VYTVLISTFNAGEETQWALSMFATNPITFDLLPPAKRGSCTPQQARTTTNSFRSSFATISEVIRLC